MRHIPVTCEQREAMLRAVGCSEMSELFSDVPDEVRLNRPLAIEGGLGEMELVAHLRGLADANEPASGLVSFAGAGCYDHYVPSIVDHVLRRPEFFTAYTPYQPEVSQGTLQAIYEYQSMICALTGMEVANASMYDGATALTEAAMMACRVTRRQRVVCAGTLHPEWRHTLATYAAAGNFDVTFLPSTAEGGVAITGWEAEVSSALEGGDVAALLLSSPNVYGNLEDVSAAASVAHDVGALLVVGANPLLLGVLEAPGIQGADIVVGEGQPLGNAMSFGGPAFGFFACREQHMRHMPGRLVGKTVDVDGNRAFVLTLSTREQHIRREKATSNICSNQALCALAAAVYLSAVGREGLAATARACIEKAHYLRDRLLETGRFAAPWDTPFAHEFALRYEGDVAAMHAALFDRGFVAGVPLSRLDPMVGDSSGNADDLVLFAVTEKRTRAEMDAFAEEVVAL
ncbi:MAG: aminomethyl-transferring glycine dehydrogenase subunit GcvPA [Anaerosomatales bacterium]|nr:aminomethyl-transferring glycine dehydrogenase subunit GcvPA [Anaerosomatales bacterium]MDT8433313.1 aminomethyl-transferring glycine dehydrogenase subunit GcvPA [Anaerosomatales bacterium]